MCIRDSTYAAQYGKGTHYGLEMLKRHMRTYFLRRKGADAVSYTHLTLILSSCFTPCGAAVTVGTGPLPW